MLSQKGLFNFHSSSLKIAFLLIFVMSSSIWAQELKPLIDKGDKFYSKGDFKSALENYFAAEKISPTDAKIKFKIGQSYLSAGEEIKALPYLEEAYQKQPNIDPDIDYYLGLALQATSHFKRAVDHFAKFKAKNKKF